MPACVQKDVPEARRVAFVAFLVFVLLGLAGCGIEVNGEEAHETGGTAAPDLADVTPLEDLRDWQGLATAVAADPDSIRLPRTPSNSCR